MLVRFNVSFVHLQDVWSPLMLEKKRFSGLLVYVALGRGFLLAMQNDVASGFFLHRLHLNLPVLG